MVVTPFEVVAVKSNDVPRTTIKETNIHDNRTGNLKEHSGGKNKVPLLDEAKVTVRKGEERLRICMHSFNRKSEIEKLAAKILAYKEETFNQRLYS